MSGLACATGTPVSRSLKEASGSSLEQLPYMGISSSFIHVYKSPSVAFLSPCVAVASPASRSVARSVGRLAGWPACLPAGLLRSAVVVVVSFSQLFRLCSALSTTTTSSCSITHSHARTHTRTYTHSSHSRSLLHRDHFAAAAAVVVGTFARRFFTTSAGALLQLLLLLLLLLAAIAVFFVFFSLRHFSLLNFLARALYARRTAA